MSSINFRLYGDQIYGFSNKYITEYISPEITKEDFLSKFESGKLSYENISTKKTIPISKQISLDELNIEKIDINIPNETENLYLYLKNVKSLVSLSEISDEEIENIIINQRKDLIDKFIEYAIKTIEKKESSKSFIEGLIENFINRAINGLKFDFYNFEFGLKFKNKKFIFVIEQMSYSEENGIKLNNVSLKLEEEKDPNNININVIDNFNISMEINSGDKIDNKENGENNPDDINTDNNNEENNEANKKNKLNIKMSNFVFLINQDVFNAVNDIYNLFIDTEYQKVYVRYKKLLQFHRPKEVIQDSENPKENDENENEEKEIKEEKYNINLSKFYYAIRTVLILRKYNKNKNENIFDLIESSQIKIAKKYLENNSETSKLILPTEINLLKATKDKVEKKILDNKKGGLANAFFSFFGGGNNDEKKELTEEEKNELDSIYTDDYINKYLSGFYDDQKGKNNPLSEKINAFMNNLVVSIDVEKIEIIVKDIYDINCNFYIRGINVIFNLNKGINDYEININDIGVGTNKSLNNEKIDKNYFIQIKKEPNNDKIKLNIKLKNVLLNGEIIIIPKKNFDDLIRAQINLPKTILQLQTSIDGEDNIRLTINDFKISYNPLEKENNDNNDNINNLDFSQKGTFLTNINIKLGSISAVNISEKKSRKIFNTKKEFININIGINEKNVDLASNFGVFNINISYQDILAVLRAFLLNKKTFEMINALKKIQPPETKVRNNLLNLDGALAENKIPPKPDNSSTPSNIFVKFSFSKIDFKLIDNSSESYQPFLYGSISEIALNYSNTKKVECNFNFLLSSYNYIASKWEPIIENLLIKLKYIFNFENENSNNDINIDINNLIINLSDMSISSTLIILQHWGDQLSKEQKYSKMNLINDNNENQTNNLNEKKKITNNVVYNYTGMDLIINYNRNDFRCQQQSKLELNYINDWDVSKLGQKNISVAINDRNNLNLNNDNKFIIFIDKLGVYEHFIDNNFLIAENTLSKNRTINISIYSQIIIKNKTFDKLQIKLINEELGNAFFLLEQNSIIGIPFNYYHDLTSFTINPITNNNLNSEDQNESKQFKLKDFLEKYQTNEFCEPFYHKNKVYYVRLINNLKNLKEILITYQYRIINCLPCEIIIENQKEGKSFSVKKFSQHFIDFYSDLDTELIFRIKVGNEYFSSVKTKYFDNAQKKQTSENYYTVFYNSDKTESFKLSIQYKKTKNKSSLIIFSDSILYNESGIDLNISSKNGNSPLCFNIGKNLYLMSSQIEDIKKVWIKLSTEKFKSKEISLKTIIEAKPGYQLDLGNNDYKLKLFIKTSISYISIRNNPNFRKNIMTMIYKICSPYRITNLLTSNNIVIKEENSNNKIIIEPLKEVNFHFFGKESNTPLSIGLLNVNNNKCSPFIEFNFSSYGIFSFCIESTLFNIEIKDSPISGIKDVFIVETNYLNAKIIIENLSDIDFTVNQKGYESYLQNISANSKEILHIYGQNNDFIIRNNTSKKSYKFSFNSNKEEEYIKELDDIVFIKESNGMQMKFIMMNKSNFNKIKSTITKLNLKIVIGNICLSAIGDNEFKDRKLRNYERNEIFLLNLSKFSLIYNLEHCSSFLDKDKVKMSITLDTFSLYNQISKYGKFSCVCKNLATPMINMETETSSSGSLSKINKLLFIISQLKLNVDPEFIMELINFFENILYRMNIINFNVDDIFLHNNKDKKIKKLLGKYKMENPICYGTNLSFPEININFDVTEIGLGQLLYEKANCSNFFIWLGYGLVGKEQNLFLDKVKIDSYLGSLGNLIQKISIIYNEQLSSEITNIGFKGLWGQIQHFFIKLDKTDKKCVDVQKNRTRHPRALYTKYKYFKSFNEDDAKYFDILKNKYHLEENGIYCCELVKGTNYLYLFTNLDLLIFNVGNYENIAKINYSAVIKLEIEKNNIIIFLNDKNDTNGKDNITICCENIPIAENVKKILSDKQTKINN